MAKVAVAPTNEERRNRTMIVAALIFAAIAAILLFVALQNSGGGDEGGAVAITTDVVVASQNIGANSRITADMVEVRAVPIDETLAGAYTSAEPVIGLPVRYPLQAGEQVTTAKLGVEAIADEKDVALILEPGMRGFALEATEVSAVGGLLLPGNFVDVIAVFSNPGRPDDVDAIIATSQTVLQHIEVLGVAQEAQEPVPAAASSGVEDDGAAAGTGIRGQRPDEVQRQPGARSVTIAVTPSQAQLLAALQSEGGVQLWLSLRPVDDTAQLPLDVTRISNFR